MLLFFGRLNDRVKKRAMTSFERDRTMSNLSAQLDYKVLQISEFKRGFRWFCKLFYTSQNSLSTNHKLDSSICWNFHCLQIKFFVKLPMQPGS